MGKANVPFIRKKQLHKKPPTRNLLSSHWPTFNPIGPDDLARGCRTEQLAFPISKVEEAKDGRGNGCWLSQPKKSAS